MRSEGKGKVVERSDSSPFGQIRFGENWEDYRPFFEHEWVPRLLELADVSGMGEPTNRLMMLWKGSSLVRSTSWLLVGSVADTIEVEAYSREPLSVSTLNGVAKMIERRAHVGGIFIDAPLRAGLVRAVEEAHSEALSNVTKRPVKMNPSDVWSRYLAIPDFTLSLWHAEMAAFSQVYFAYECFLVDSMKLRLGLSKLWARDLARAGQGRVPESLLESVVRDERVRFARFMRHAIVHNGGKMTDDLRPFSEWIHADDNGLISIGPDQTRMLFRLLWKKSAELLAWYAGAPRND